MDKIPQKGILGNTPTTPNKGVVIGVPQKKQYPENEKWELNKERFPEQNKTLEPTMSMENIPPLAGSFGFASKNISIPVKKRPVEKVFETPVINEALRKESAVDGVSEIPTLRTYKKDVASTITNQKTSLVRMVLEEEKVRQKKERDESPRTRKNFSLIIFSAIFFLATLAVIYYAFFRSSGTNKLLTELNFTPFFNTEVSQELSIDNKSKKDIVNEIQQEITGTNLRLDTIKNIFFTEKFSTETADGPVIRKKLVTAPDLFDKIEIFVPPVLLRTIKDDFMFGYHSFNGNHPFIVLNTDYYNNAFSGMLEWESTMSDDLQPLFGTIGLEDLKERTWRDTITKNKDTRTLNNFDDGIALVYMFKDKKTIIITTDNSTLFEVSKRIDFSTKKTGI